MPGLGFRSILHLYSIKTIVLSPSYWWWVRINKNESRCKTSNWETSQRWKKSCFDIFLFHISLIKLQMPHCFVSLCIRNFELSFPASFYLQHNVTWTICCIMYCFEASEHITAKLCDNSRKKMGLIYSSLGKHSPGPSALWFPWVLVGVLSVPTIFLSHYWDISLDGPKTVQIIF